MNDQEVPTVSKTGQDPSADDACENQIIQVEIKSHCDGR